LHVTIARKQYPSLKRGARVDFQRQVPATTQKDRGVPPARKIKIGFIGSSAPASPHHESFKTFIPKDIDFTIVQESGAKTSLYGIESGVSGPAFDSRPETAKPIRVSSGGSGIENWNSNAARCAIRRSSVADSEIRAGSWAHR
jgi:hypothetical protein